MQSHNNPFKLFTVKIIFKRELWIYFNIFGIIWTSIFKIRPKRFLNDPVRGPDSLVQWGLEATWYYHIPKHKNTFSSTFFFAQAPTYLVSLQIYVLLFYLRGKKKNTSFKSFFKLLSKQ